MCGIVGMFDSNSVAVELTKGSKDWSTADTIPPASLPSRKIKSDF